MASVTRTWIRPNAEKREQHVTRPNGLTLGRPDEAESPVDYPGKYCVSTPAKRVFAGPGPMERALQNAADEMLQVVAACVETHLLPPTE